LQLAGDESLAFGVIGSLRFAVIYYDRWKIEVRGQRSEGRRQTAEGRTWDCGMSDGLNDLKDFL